jgi:hypothetical protein
VTAALFERRLVTVNTDPQRRCYDGANFSERTEWSEWVLVCPYASLADALAAAETFRGINPAREYCVLSTADENAPPAHGNHTGAHGAPVVGERGAR